jgi:hypothetical protein
LNEARMCTWPTCSTTTTRFLALSFLFCAIWLSQKMREVLALAARMHYPQPLAPIPV